MDCSMPGFPVLHYLLNLLKFMSIGSATLSNHLVLCHLLLLLPLVFPSIRVFSNESALHIKRPEYWSFSFNISPSNEYSGLTSFRIDWFDLLTIQGILKSLLQHHSSKASILQHSAIFMDLDQQIEFRELKCCFFSVANLLPPPTWADSTILTFCKKFIHMPARACDFLAVRR